MCKLCLETTCLSSSTSPHCVCWDVTKAWRVWRGVSAHVCNLVTVYVCDLIAYCAGLQRPELLLLPLRGSGLKIMWCAVSGGAQGADS